MISIGLLGRVRTHSGLCGEFTYFEVGDQESLAQVGPYCFVMTWMTRLRSEWSIGSGRLVGLEGWLAD
jgi:hypothetical protein